MQVESDYLRTAGEFQELIDDKVFLKKAAELEESNRKRFGASKVVEMRSEMDQRAERVLAVDKNWAKLMRKNVSHLGKSLHKVLIMISNRRAVEVR